MIRNEMATANNRSRAQVDTVIGAGVGFGFLGSAFSVFVGSTEGKGNSTSLLFYPKLFKQPILIDRLLADPRIPGYLAEACSAGFVEML